jgi:type I restriction enzyme M protein
MLTGALRNDIDRLWERFWTGGITNPLTVIEQISFLMFARLLDITEAREEKRAQRLKVPGRYLFDIAHQHIRWKNLIHRPGPELLQVMKEEVFPHFATVTLDGTEIGEYMRDATLEIKNANLLVTAVEMIDKLPLDKGDTKGDLYEYLLSKLTTAGINGQFRTPRHIIDMMVELVDVQPSERICDPACGTGGFLARSMEYLNRTHTSPELVERDEDGNAFYIGDLLEPYREHIEHDMFYGFDFDTTMLRVASMNLLLHGVGSPQIHYQDTLNKSMDDPQQGFPRFEENAFDVILANPPFKGSLDESSTHPKLLAMVKTKKTELLFIARILRMLKLGGRSATIVPDGVLFGSSKAHKALRQLLVEHNQLEAVISLPSGVFKPYAGVSTAILLFTKGGNTEQVFFYDVQADGYSLDDKRQPVQDNDLPDVLAQWKRCQATPDAFAERTAKAFAVPVQAIRDQGYDLSLNRYKEVVHVAVQHEDPKQILKRMKALELSILKEMEELEGML